DLLHEFQRLIQLRKSHVSLRRGSYHCLLATDDVHAHLRQQAEESVIVLLNTSNMTKRVDLNVADYLADGTQLHCPWTREGRGVTSGQFGRIELAPRSGRVFTTQPS